MATLEEMRAQSARELRQLREITGTSRAKMAELLEVDIKTYSKMEDGTSKIEEAQMIYIRDLLGVSSTPAYLRIKNPELYVKSAETNTPEKRRERVLYYVRNIADDYQIECMDMITDGRHGSDVAAVLTGEVMNMKSRMEYRVLLAQNNLMHYRLCDAMGLLLFPEIKPDVKAYEAAVVRGREAVLDGRDSYSTMSDHILSELDKTEGEK